MCLLGCVGALHAAAAQTVLPPPSKAVQPLTLLEKRCWQLSDTEHDQRPVVLAMISTRMGYSVTEWARLRDQADAAGFRVLLWRDPLDSTDAQAVPGTSTVSAGCLPVWGVINHYPFVRVALGNHVHAWPVWGVMPDHAWRETLLQRLRGLQDEPDAATGAPHE